MERSSSFICLWRIRVRTASSVINLGSSTIDSLSTLIMEGMSSPAASCTWSIGMILVLSSLILLLILVLRPLTLSFSVLAPLISLKFVAIMVSTLLTILSMFVALCNFEHHIFIVFSHFILLINRHKFITESNEVNTEDYQIGEMGITKDGLIRASLYTNLLGVCSIVGKGVKGKQQNHLLQIPAHACYYVQ